MNKQVKRGWRSGREIVNERGVTIQELFDYMKRGLQAYTNGHDKVVDCDFLLPVKRKLLAEINAEIKRDFAKPDVREISELEIKQMVQCRYNDITGGLFDHPKGCTLMSFNKMGNNSLSEVLDFQFKAVEVDEFFDSEYSQNHLPTYEEIQKGKERKAWDFIRDRGISQEIQDETYESLLDKELQSTMLNNRSRIRADSEENSNETDNSILSIILEDKSIIADLAGSEGTESERELKAWHISSRLVGSEEVRNVVNEYKQTHGIKSLEPSLPTAPQGQPEKPIEISAIPTEKQPEPETTPIVLGVSDYIETRRAEKVRDEIIAVELNDKAGTYRFSLVKTARSLCKEKGVNLSHSGWKMRGFRMVNAGRRMMNES